MKKLNKKVTIAPVFVAEDWQLYSSSMSATECFIVCNTLNTALKTAVDESGSTHESVYKAMIKVMNEYSKYGAMDSEPIYFLKDILDEVYGPDKWSE
jgi:hypothetical protein